ncbi:hypothetical protein HZB02_03015 [Candidatus Woesearchaeota archaeon]|nr:hypothetical protein [Candidatus Woesearchaeota archaeon]
MLEQQQFLASGKRGDVFVGFYHGKKAAMKQQRKDSKGTTIQFEGLILQKLNQYGIGPKLLASGSDWLIYEFVDGIRCNEFVETASKQQIIMVLHNLINQLALMDSLGYNKEEMHHPYKHVLIENNKPVLIDFERCRKTEKAKNVTQCCQWLTGKHLQPLLAAKGIVIDRTLLLSLAKEYKQGKKDVHDVKKAIHS